MADVTKLDLDTVSEDAAVKLILHFITMFNWQSVTVVTEDARAVRMTREDGFDV